MKLADGTLSPHYALLLCTCCMKRQSPESKHGSALLQCVWPGF